MKTLLIILLSCACCQSIADTLNPTKYINGTPDPTKSTSEPVMVLTVEDPTLDQLRKVARQQNARYQVLKKTINRYDPTRTNLFARPARASMQTKLTTAREQAAALYVDLTNQLAQTVAYSNAYLTAKRIADSATAKIQDEIADLQVKIEKYKEYQTKYPILKSIFAAMITDAENRIKILTQLNQL